jgi:DNA-binding LacI/PurR family transcriptional regulator
MTRRATIRDVAARAGVSPAAVSKVLRNAYGLSDEMRQRVTASMRELNYRPQLAARGLRGSTYTLGVLLPDIRNPFFPDILDGIVATLSLSDYQPLLGVRPSAELTERGVVETMLDRKVDGFIMIAPLLDHAFLETVARQVPLVIIGRHDRDGGFDTINNDDEMGARLVVEHLVSLGHKRISYFGLEISEVGETNPAVFRHRGYVNAMTEHGLGEFVAVSNSSKRHGAVGDGKRAAEILANAGRPTAIFAWTDSVAIATMAVASGLGLKVPQHLSVVGYDNAPIGALPQLSLTSIDQSAHHLGARSTALLMERIDGRSDEVHEVVAPRLEIRGSTSAWQARGDVIPADRR